MGKYDKDKTTLFQHYLN